MCTAHSIKTMVSNSIFVVVDNDQVLKIQSHVINSFSTCNQSCDKMCACLCVCVFASTNASSSCAQVGSQQWRCACVQ